ncbi:hypothetical protein H5410_022083 [Solanum commersonii]|uniref:Uncharacterized protein n=1 Tax=Solanum commersonii TaxID=4109 RepID=A0A9J5ZDS3_SOLCO|nr:hypothetical protein H5410_022083 [Solanum commersonii]
MGKRKTSAFSIGRIFFVPPGSGEQYYLRLLLNAVKGPTSYEEIRRINDIDHETFRDACYALGLLDDDKEYVMLSRSKSMGNAIISTTIICYATYI